MCRVHSAIALEYSDYQLAFKTWLSRRDSCVGSIYVWCNTMGQYLSYSCYFKGLDSCHTELEKFPEQFPDLCTHVTHDLIPKHWYILMQWDIITKVYFFLFIKIKNFLAVGNYFFSYWKLNLDWSCRELFRFRCCALCLPCSTICGKFRYWFFHCVWIRWKVCFAEIPFLAII